MTPSPALPSRGAARAAWSAVEPLHAFSYFAPQAAAGYESLGLDPRTMGYFAARSAALGATSAEVVSSTFYSFNPELVGAVIPKIWQITTPEAVLAARLRAVDEALRHFLGDEVVASDTVATAAELAQSAAMAATRHVHGRPLFAAHAALAWPSEPHLVLWHAQTLLREFRGDGHIVALMHAGLAPVESLVSHATATQWSTKWMRKSRGWSNADWEGAVAALAERGLVRFDEGETVTLTEAGERLRAAVEERTDELALVPYAAIGDEGCRRLAELVRPLSRTLGESRLLPQGLIEQMEAAAAA
ncbi:SCO6745 family protein [Salinactinospora qingdaonensis]|uniref:SalK n=1 Tax=Salinactinospora qingdaonensis TaxID=702744 RepID=A0ABP7GBY1_9ACTN